MAPRHHRHARAASLGLRVVHVATAALAATAALLPLAGLAAVEFVTPVGTCDKVDTTADGKDLSVQAGPDRRFEVWGDGIDINPSVRVTIDDSINDTLVTARIIRAHNGAENLLRGCKIAKGSVEVEVDSPDEAGATRQRSLRFRMPLGDESRLPMRTVPYRTPVWTVTEVRQRPADCLTKGVGTVVRDLNNTRLTITLPPGASSDTSNCTVDVVTWVSPEDRPEIDIQGQFRYAVRAPLLTLYPGADLFQGALQSKAMLFSANVADIRRTTAMRSNTLTVATPNPNRMDSLALVINPPPSTNAFTQDCICRNAATGTTINVNDDFQCEIRLSQLPPAGGQLISIEARDRLCVAAGAQDTTPPTLSPGEMTYSSASGLGGFQAPATSAFHQIPFRAQGGNTSAGTPCASLSSPVAHTMKFWVGARGAETRPTFTQCQIRIRSPQ